MVDDFQHRGIHDSAHRLLKLVVVDQDHPFIVIIHHMIAGDIADQMVFQVHDRIGPESGSRQFLAHIVRDLICIKADHLPAHDVLDGRRQIKITAGIHCPAA